MLYRVTFNQNLSERAITAVHWSVTLSQSSER